MKWSIVLFAIAAFTSSVAAQHCRVFGFKVVNSPHSDLNGHFLQNIGGRAGFGSSTGIQTTAYWDDVAPVQLYANGIDGEGSDSFMLVPTSPSGIESLVFADYAVAEARWTDWDIIDGILTYGGVTDKFVAFPAVGTGGGWVISWVPDGVFITANSFSVDLQMTCP